VAAGSAVDASAVLLGYPGQDVAGVVDSRDYLRTGSDGHFYFTNTGKRATFSAEFYDERHVPAVRGMRFGSWGVSGKSCGLPTSYSAQLTVNWNAWLASNYGSDSALSAAWAPGA
jgi:hypothetical protein